VLGIFALAILLILPAIKRLGVALEREREMRLNLDYIARHDAMTGLLNRSGFEERIAAVPEDATYAYGIVDLNMFKPINDTFGHAAGDAVLIEIAQRLKAVTIGNAIAARIGGDEYAVFDPGAKTHEDCEKLGKAITEVFGPEIPFEEKRFKVGAAVGLALSSQTEGGFDTVATAADAAMYSLKGKGRTLHRVYSEDLAADVPSLQRKAVLEEAIRNREFEPWFQPKISLETGEIVGFEALCRWRQSGDTIALPAEFLPDITRYDLQAALTDTVLTQSLHQLKTWQEDGLEPPRVAINVSAETLASEAGLEAINWRLAEYDQVQHLVIIEITEDVFLPRVAEAVNRAIAGIAGLGVHISIDDFGSGYASFRHLNEITFHELKVDSTFVSGIGKDPNAEVILEAFMSIARGLSVTVVAEGIETKEQRDFLADLGCHIGQGFLFYPALSASATTDLMTTLQKPNNREIA